MLLIKNSINSLLNLFQENIKKPSELKAFLMDFNKSILLEADSHNNLTTRSFFFLNENAPISILTQPNEVAFLGIIDEFNKGSISPIRKSLYKSYNIKVFYGKEDVNIISYSSVSNINSEILKILDDVDSDNSLSNFLSNLLNKFGETINYSEEFLNVNNTLPKMFTTQRIFVYSALLNYSYSEIQKTSIYKEYLGNLINNPAKIPENWDKIRYIFKEFLDQLLKRTINY